MLLCTTKWVLQSSHETSSNQYNARSNRSHPPNSPNTAPATKKNRMIDPRHIWNVQYNAQSNRSHPPTSPNTAPATKNESRHWSASHMKRPVECAEQQESPSNFTKYCPFHEKWLSWLISIKYETSSTMRAATGVILQLHQILRLPRNMNLMIDPRHIWNVQYNAQSNRSHPPTWPNTVPATKNESRHCSVTYETSSTMRGASGVTLQLHQILHLPRKMNLMIDQRHIWNVQYNAPSNRSHLPTSPNTAHAPKKILMIDQRHIWNVQYNAGSIRSHPPTSPNTAPATKNDSHDWYSSHMKRYLQSAEQQGLPSNITKYCACHEILSSRFEQKTLELLPPI